jgi:hypothetical protein
MYKCLVHASDHFDRLYRQHERYWWRDKDRYATDQDAYPYSLLTQQTAHSDLPSRQSSARRRVTY